MNPGPECISVPTCVITSSLTLQQIGALVCILGGLKELESRFSATDELKTTIKSLVDLGVVTTSAVGKEITIKINLNEL